MFDKREYSDRCQYRLPRAAVQEFRRRPTVDRGPLPVGRKRAEHPANAGADLASLPGGRLRGVSPLLGVLDACFVQLSGLPRPDACFVQLSGHVRRGFLCLLRCSFSAPFAQVPALCRGTWSDACFVQLSDPRLPASVSHRTGHPASAPGKAGQREIGPEPTPVLHRAGRPTCALGKAGQRRFGLVSAPRRASGQVAASRRAN